MTAIPHAAEALTSALDRLDHAQTRVLEAVSGAANEDIGNALADASQARMQFRAAVAVIHISDDMFRELINIRAND